MSTDDTRGALPGAETDGGAAPGEAARSEAARGVAAPGLVAPGEAASGTAPTAPLGNRLALWAGLYALDVAVGLMWALLLVAAILFISGVSQFIYVDF